MPAGMGSRFGVELWSEFNSDGEEVGFESSGGARAEYLFFVFTGAGFNRSELASG